MSKVFFVVVMLMAVWAGAFALHHVHAVVPTEAGGAIDFDGVFRWQDIPIIVTVIAVVITCACALGMEFE